MPNLLPDWHFFRPNGRLIWFTLLALVMIGAAVWKMRTPKPDRPSTWAEAMGGAIFVFAVFLLTYAIIPHEFITAADKYWAMSTNRYLFKSGTAIPFLTAWDWPFSIDLQHGVRDPLVVVIYNIFFGLNIALFVMWQKRPTQAEFAERTPVAAGTSRFGRPLKAKA